VTAASVAAASVTKALGGRNGMARCPAHDDKTPSLSVSERDGKLLVHCHAGCSQEAVWAVLVRLGLVQQAVRGAETAVSRPKHFKSPDGELKDRHAEALAFWSAAVPAAHTPAQDYLACRGIVIGPAATLRYHEADNALVAAIQDQDGALTGVQRIYLKTDSRGTWATGKRSLGTIKGGACRLTAAADRLQLCESIEDGLALLQMTGRPTWAVPGAGFMVDFEPPPEVREIVLAPDHDKAGLEAIEKSVKSYMHITFRQLLPPPGLDWCDVLEDYEERAAIREYDGGLDREQAETQSWVEAFANGD
jgi:hypothetical protein